jgi:membrane protease YdiL (CAAX protease family)
VAVPRDPAPAREAAPELSRLADFVGDTIEVGEAQAAAARATPTGRFGDRSPDIQAAIVLLVAALCLNGARFSQRLIPSEWSRFAELNTWAGTQILFYAVIPLLVWRYALRLPVVDIGLRLRGTSEHWKVYLGLFLVAVPFVLVASTTAEFQINYPLLETFRGDDPWPALWVWWGFYAVQFLAIEIFFRGFLIHGLVPRFGAMAILVMVIPYTMIHFVKPPAEALAAIVGGVVMGTLSLRTRSIWWGVGLHCGVAAVMDVASLWHKDLLP